MFSKVPVITNAGKTALLLAADGHAYTITRFEAGSGFLQEGETEAEQLALINKELEFSITSTETVEDEGYIKISGSFNNWSDDESGAQTDFLWTELGLIAEDEDGNEILYAYANDAYYAELIHGGASAVISEQLVTVILYIGTTENVEIRVSANALYADKEDFDDHVADQSNPHGVTAAQTGAAAAVHAHSASDIMSGTLSVARGGTGTNNLQALAATLGPMIGQNFVIGSFVGDGRQRRNILLGFKPSAVYMFPLVTGGSIPIGNTSTGKTLHYIQGERIGYYGNTATFLGAGYYFAPGQSVCRKGYYGAWEEDDGEETLNAGYGGAGVTDTGFVVGYNATTRNDINKDGTVYFYIAMR